MEVEQRKPDASPAMTFDEASLERSKGFVKALQELKNLRPQLYSAAEYCEKSYLHSEQKQMVLDNLKDYAVRAVVNAVDHLGTVAFKLNDLLDQQTIAVNTMDVKITSLNQQILTCQTYMDKEGLRQQKLLAIIPRHHKRYILPNSASKKVHFSPTVHGDPRHIHAHAKPRINPPSSPTGKTLSWHLTSEAKPSIKGKSSASSDPQKSSARPVGVFHLLDNEDNFQVISSVTAQPQPSNRNPASGVAVQPFGATHKDPSTGSGQPMTPFRSFDNTTRQQQQQIICAPPRSKSMLSAFFVKQKTPKLKAGTVA